MRYFLPFLLVFSLLLPLPAQAINLIRDAEIEKTLKEYSAPIFRQAGLDPESMNIYIVNDSSINAFTIGGLNLFINTGLILRSEDSNMVIGVIAHETGHIAGGHIVKRMGEVDNLNIQSILAAVLGASVAVAGLPDAGVAVMAGSQHIMQRNYMSFNREQEVAADAAAIKYLHRSNQSTRGMLKLFEILRRDQTLSYGAVDQYAISHPLSQERIGHIRSEGMDEPQETEDKFAEQHARMVAKLYGFLEKPANTFIKYNDQSPVSLYARSIAYFRQSNFEKSFAEVDKLIAQYPNDPFYNELKGQFLVESGKTQQAMPYYETANRLYPNSSLIKAELGKVYLDANQTTKAITVLSQASKLEPTSSSTWRLLATAYGKMNDEPMSNLMLAEEANVMGKNSDARNFARLAKDKLPKNSPGWIRANDILADIKLKKETGKDKENKEKDE